MSICIGRVLIVPHHSPQTRADDQLSILPAASFHRTRRPSRKEMFAICAVRAAWCATRMFAFGVFRLRMQSSQFCRCVSVPSPLERT